MHTKSSIAACNKLLGFSKLTPTNIFYKYLSMDKLRDSLLINCKKLGRTKITTANKYSTGIAQKSLTILTLHSVSISQQNTIIKNSKHTSCDLDPIQSSLLLEYLDNILPTLTHITNTSLLYGQFLTNMNTTSV